MMLPRSVLLIALSTALLGMACVREPPPGAQPTDLDFDAIYPDARLSTDLTDRNLGLMAGWKLLKRDESSSQPPLIRNVASTSYAIRFDEESSRQIVALPGTTN